MKKFIVNINNFKWGEITKNIFPANNIKGAKNLINFIPGNNNILMRRPGSKYIFTLPYNPGVSIKYLSLEIKNVVYLLEFSPGKLRIYKNNNIVYKNAAIYELDTPYTQPEHLNSLNSTKGYKDNEILLFSQYTAPLLLSKNINLDEFVFSPVEFNDGPYENINTTDISLVPQSLIGENINVKASGPLFAPLEVGLHLRLYDEKTQKWGWGIINKYISSTQVEVNIKSGFASLLPTLIWCKGLFNTNKGYPSIGLIFNSRLYIACTSSNKTTIWASCYNDYFSFAPTELQVTSNVSSSLLNGEGYKYSITFNNIDIKEILWLKNSPFYLIAGSKEGIYVYMPLDTNKALSPFNYTIQRIGDGSKNKVVTNKQFIIYENLDSNINSLEIISGLGTYNIVENILTIANQIKENIKISDIVFNNTVESIITILLNNGKLLFLNINRESNAIFYAFSKANIGGKGKVLLIHSYNKFLYLVVERTINEKTVITLEYINWLELYLALEENFNIKDSTYYLDCLKNNTYYKPINLVEVATDLPTAIIADNHYLGEFSNEKGLIYLKSPASNIIRGYNYSSSYDSNCLNNYQIDYDLSGYKKITQITLNFINSLGGELITSHYKLQNLAAPFLKDIGKTFCTGYRAFTMNSIYYNDISFKINQQLPFPLNINLIKVELLVN